jgi:hypothetical protein
MLNGPKTSHLAMAKQTPMKLGVFDFQIRRKAPAHKPPSKIFEACYKPTPTAPMMQSSAKAGPTPRSGYMSGSGSTRLTKASPPISKRAPCLTALAKLITSPVNRKAK